MTSIKPKLYLILLAVVAAILYNLWFLGYLLDPSPLQNSYISALYLSGKPYAWLFTLADISAAIIVIVVSLGIRKLKPQQNTLVTGYLVFGVATFFEALMPISSKCATSIASCGISPTQIFTPHDIASIVAVVGLFVGLRTCLRFFEKDAKYQRLLSYTFWLLSIATLFLILSVVIDSFTMLSQALFLIACGVVLIVIPTSALRDM